MFVSAGSVRTSATSPVASSRSSASTSLNSTTRVVTAGSTGGPRLPLRARTIAVRAERRERLVDGAVVAPVEDEDGRPPGEMTREPDDEAVGVGRGQRELPRGDAESPGQLVRHPERVLAREHERDALGRLVGHRLQRRLRCVPRHRPRVAEAEVDVLVAVDVHESCPLRLCTKTGKPPGHLRIQCMGTPSKSDARARSASSRERGCVSTKRASSRACSSARRAIVTGASLRSREASARVVFRDKRHYGSPSPGAREAADRCGGRQRL